MNCHGTQDSNQKTKGSHGGHWLHGILMVVCCALLIATLASLPLIAKVNPALGQFLGNYAWMICPLLMIPMAAIMISPKKKDHS